MVMDDVEIYSERFMKGEKTEYWEIFILGVMF